MAKHVGFNEYRKRLEGAGVKHVRDDREWQEFEVPGRFPVRILIHFDPSDDSFDDAELTVEMSDQEHRVTRYRSMVALDRALGITS